MESEFSTTVSIDPRTRIGAVSLTVMDLDRQIAFHQEVLGMQLHWREGVEAAMGAGEADLLHFYERSDARPARRTTGLYHTAILVPTKWDLAHVLKRIHDHQAPVQGYSNHGTHLALYLPDAEGNGIEVAWDFPRDEWPDLGAIVRSGDRDMMRHLTMPLDIEDLLSELERNPAPWPGMPPGTQIGHIHLHVSDLDATRRFYHDLLGFDIKIDSNQLGMIFLSAGGYHHHIGGNVWHGVGAPPPPPDAAGLRYFSVVLPDRPALDAVVGRLQEASAGWEQTERGLLLRDPAHNGVLLTTE